jgi:hypothetical protein
MTVSRALVAERHHGGRHRDDDRPGGRGSTWCPAGCYRRDPTACLAVRERKLAKAVQQRALNWKAYAHVKEQRRLSLA